MKQAADRVAAWLHDARQARNAGDRDAAGHIYRRILADVPDHPAAANALGMMALERGDAAESERMFLRATRGDPGAAELWVNLATARRGLGDDPGERAALERALAIEQRHVMANVRMAELHERAAEEAAALFRWGGVVALVGAMQGRSPALEDLLAHAQQRLSDRTRQFGTAVDAGLATARAELAPRERRRFDACIEAMLGRRRIFQHEPHGLHFPFLPADEFFDETLFPWLGEIEAHAPAIRQELEALLAAPDSGFAPYVETMPGAPASRWTPLSGSLAWSARYLWKYGVRQADMCVCCPQTAAVLGRLPLADMPDKGPTAFFSVLQPGARLPPHSGVSNVRAIVHLPLIVPPGCGFRVGGETRAWVEGKAFAFDDTIEHEAWNGSDSLRAVLIFDVWNPHLTLAERDMLRELFRLMPTLEDAPAGVGAVAD